MLEGILNFQVKFISQETEYSALTITIYTLNCDGWLTDDGQVHTHLGGCNANVMGNAVLLLKDEATLVSNSFLNIVKLFEAICFKNPETLN